MTPRYKPQCTACIHFRANYACAAFPGGIPEDVLFNRVDHREPVEGDNGVRFEAKAGKQHPFEEVP